MLLNDVRILSQVSSNQGINGTNRLSIHRYRVAFFMLILTTTTLWFWIWDGYWQHFGSFPSNDLQDSFYESQAEDKPPISVDSHVEPNIVNPAGSNDIIADLQRHHSAVVEHLFPASAMDSWMVPNRKALRDLLTCLAQNACLPNQEKSTL